MAMSWIKQIEVKDILWEVFFQGIEYITFIQYDLLIKAGFNQMVNMMGGFEFVEK